MADRALFTDSLTVTGSPANNQDIRLGFAFGMNAAATLNGLGRWVVAGNSGTHLLEIGLYTPTTASTGAVTILGSVTVDTNGATPGEFLYANFGSPVNLSGGTSYVILSTEVNGGDEWLGATTEPTFAADAGPGELFDISDNFQHCYTTDLTGDVPAGGCTTATSSPGTSYVPVSALWDGPGLTQTITDAGAIASSAAVGSPTLTQGPAPQTITDAGGIASSAAVGTPTLLNLAPDVDAPNTVASLLVSAAPRFERTGNNLCPCDDWPFANVTAEAPDSVVYISNRPWGDPDPPIGVPYRATGCLGIATSTISQADADAQAFAQAALCASDPGDTNPSPDGDPNPTLTDDGGPPPGFPPGSVVFYNVQQEQDVCPSDVFAVAGALPSGFYVLESGAGIGINAGVFHSWISQADANAAALAELRAAIDALTLAGIIHCVPRYDHPEDILGAAIPRIDTLGIDLPVGVCNGGGGTPIFFHPGTPCWSFWSNAPWAMSITLDSASTTFVFRRLGWTKTFRNFSDDDKWYVIRKVSAVDVDNDHFHFVWACWRSIESGLPTPIGEYEQFSAPSYLGINDPLYPGLASNISVFDEADSCDFLGGGANIEIIVSPLP